MSNDAAYSRFLREAAKTPLLSADEELSLARTIRAGRDAQTLRDTIAAFEIDATGDGDLFSGSADHLDHLIETGRAAREHFTMANIRLVMHEAKRWHQPANGADIHELIQSGLVGLLNGIDRYDPARGNRFSTYGTWWIRQAITEHIATTSRSVKVPARIITEIWKVSKVTTAFYAEHLREPSTDEIAAATGFSVEKVTHLSRWLGPAAALDETFGSGDGDGEGGTTLRDTLVDTDAIDPHEAAEASEAATLLRAEIAKLEPIEADVVTLGFGLGGGSPMTLADVGIHLGGLSKTRVHTIMTRALSKMRHPANAAGLAAYI